MNFGAGSHFSKYMYISCTSRAHVGMVSSVQSADPASGSQVRKQVQTRVQTCAMFAGLAFPAGTVAEEFKSERLIASNDIGSRTTRRRIISASLQS